MLPSPEKPRAHQIGKQALRILAISVPVGRQVGCQEGTAHIGQMRWEGRGTDLQEQPVDRI